MLDFLTINLLISDSSVAVIAKYSSMVFPTRTNIDVLPKTHITIYTLVSHEDNFSKNYCNLSIS